MKGETKPGDLIQKSNEGNPPRLLYTNSPFHPKQKIAIDGMV